MESLKSRAIGWLITSAIIITIFGGGILLMNAWKSRSPNKDDRKLKEVRLILEEIPLYPGSVEKSSSEASRAYDAGISKHCQVPATYESVLLYYSNALGSKGWTLFKREDNVSRVVFKKGEYLIDLARESQDSLGNNSYYSVSYVWQDPNSPLGKIH